ncbi:hypothetical protein CBR_g19185 [Chara braunii]|uniref:Uncharacterized protein n=1 Tax=Chara braunii TaxID=69332 RepID=A0A388JTH8_CHABU|nr:hypothetical protein CBR_g19185 [Chara braunii]|eukprot:GBG61108.1 hypothetical protein CBR_g19185 [Chara braunii]
MRIPLSLLPPPSSSLPLLATANGAKISFRGVIGYGCKFRDTRREQGEGSRPSRSVVATAKSAIGQTFQWKSRTSRKILHYRLLGVDAPWRNGPNDGRVSATTGPREKGNSSS